MFKDIPGYEGLYAINEQGEVLSSARPGNDGARLLRPRKNKRGYLGVSLSRNNLRKNYNVHRLVALTFIPNPEGLPQVNHKDLNPQNNNVNNLEWCTRSYNAKHAIKNGVLWNLTNRKFTIKEAEKVRELYKTGCYSYAKLAKIFTVSVMCISKIINNKTYKNP